MCASFVQAGFQARLLSEVKAFKEDAAKFGADWEANGPMVPGLDPMAAEERLKKFQQLFEVGFVAPWGMASAFARFPLPIAMQYSGLISMCKGHACRV